ncbi:MAG: L-threonylcarbamoyladenylate synthase [Candidatus Aminicenantes bacterium]|nr:L-threonylcarbamoyladenylate synthase [Candidatus Aminicenantes bacterium]
MSFRVVRINPKKYDLEPVRKIRDDILAGGIVIFPTETFYGLGANAFSPDGVREVYAFKERDKGKPLPIVAADAESVLSYSEHLPRVFFDLIRQFWPGPLTLVVHARPLFPPKMLGPNNTIAVRVPGMAWLRDFLKDLGVPLTSTSANRSGHGEIADPFKIFRDFEDRNVTIIDAGRTTCGLSSTIVDVTSNPPKILREGAIPTECVAPFLF